MFIKFGDKTKPLEVKVGSKPDDKTSDELLHDDEDKLGGRRANILRRLIYGEGEEKPPSKD